MGSGMNGNVYKGTLVNNHERVAIKVLNARPRVRMLAVNEASIMKILENTSFVPKCYGIINEDGGNPAIAIEYLREYKTLKELLLAPSARNIFNRQNLLKIAVEISKAVKEFHSRQVQHNDIKYDNIMVNMKTPDEPKVKFIDFGSATHKNAHRKKDGTDRVNWTSFLAPEVQRGEFNSPMSDIYSLGKVFLILSSGMKMEIPDLKDLAGWCRSKKPEDRPTIQAVLDCVQCIINKHSS